MIKIYPPNNQPIEIVTISNKRKQQVSNIINQNRHKNVKHNQSPLNTNFTHPYRNQPTTCTNNPPNSAKLVEFTVTTHKNRHITINPTIITPTSNHQKQSTHAQKTTI